MRCKAVLAVAFEKNIQEMSSSRHCNVKVTMLEAVVKQINLQRSTKRLVLRLFQCKWKTNAKKIEFFLSSELEIRIRHNSTQYVDV